MSYALYKRFSLTHLSIGGYLMPVEKFISHITLEGSKKAVNNSTYWKDLLARLTCTASRFMPILRHLLYRQNWHLFRCLLSIMQFLSSRQAYVKSLRTVLLKNPLQPSQLKWLNIFRGKLEVWCFSQYQPRCCGQTLVKADCSSS